MIYGKGLYGIFTEQFEVDSYIYQKLGDEPIIVDRWNVVLKTQKVV